MKSKSKIIISDINRKENLTENLPAYAGLLAQRYNAYATVRGSMNFYTIREVLIEHPEEKKNAREAYQILRDLLNNHMIHREKVTEDVLKQINDLRDKLAYRMRILTAFTDGFQIYEYVLNRIEYGIKGGIQEIDTETFASRMMQYVFAEKDTVVINSKLQLLLGQLPVRMTKNRFFDIVASTLNIYQSGETTSVDDFCDMLLSTVLAKRPEGFETEYPELYKLYEDFNNTDFKEISEHDFDDLSERMDACVRVITDEVSDFMLLSEITNDVYTVLLTVDECDEANRSQAGYAAATEIFRVCIQEEGELSEQVMDHLTDCFMAIEGTQEDYYSDVMVLEASFEDIKSGNAADIESLGLKERFADLDKISGLLSTSLYVDINKDAAGEVTYADAAYIENIRRKTEESFIDVFAGKQKLVVRAMMAKLLSAMPIFMNTTDEIKSYFDYVLDRCSDEAELYASCKLINDLIEEE